MCSRELVIKTNGEKYCDFADDELDEVIKDLIECNQAIGPNAVQARLKGEGIFTQRQRVRDSLARVDQAGCVMRSLDASQTIQRGTYKVDAPFSLWHIDGYHKLVK